MRCTTRITAGIAVAIAIGSLAAPSAPFLVPVHAASSAGCEGGGYSIVLPGGTTVAGDVDTNVPAASLGASFRVKGKYNEFEVVSATFEVRDYAFTGAPNPLVVRIFAPEAATFFASSRLTQSLFGR